MIQALVNHLWQSTLFAVAAGLLTLTLRKSHPGVRYAVWLTASLKFLFPFSLLMSLGSHWSLPAVAATPHPFTSVVFEEFGQPLKLVASPVQTFHRPVLEPLLVSVWAMGVVVVLFSRWRAWRRVQSVVRASTPLDLSLQIRTLSSPMLIEPGVVGIWRPALLLPQGITEHLSPTQLEAIIAHELCHVRRRDNLAAALHMIVEALFWFHPLIWWLGARLVEERERACDEEVLRTGNHPQVYAESVLKACRFYLESPLACVSGVTGSDLRKRIERILGDHISRQLSLGRKALLSVAALAAVAGPIGLGLINAPVRAQTQSASASATPAFEVASIRQSQPGLRGVSIMMNPGGRLVIKNLGLRAIVGVAYKVPDFRISGGPGWIGSDKYDITAKAEDKAGPDQIRQMLQALLADRFQLALRRETKELPVYALVIGKNGLKMRQSDPGECPATPVAGHPCGGFRISMRRHISGDRIRIDQLTEVLSTLLGRTVIDKTGLQGTFDMKLEWTPDESQMAFAEPESAPRPDGNNPSIFTAIQEQLGLRLESQKAPVEILIIDRAEKPSEN